MYPLGATNASVEQTVRSCGYASARGVGGLYEAPAPTPCYNCPFAEGVPPADPYLVRTPNSIVSTTTLARLEQYVTDAEANGGGWVPLVFHHICDNTCDPYSIAPADMAAFLDWLAPRAAQGTVVRPVRDVRPVPAGPNLLQDVSLESYGAGAAQAPDCWQRTGFTNGAQPTFTWSRTADAHSGAYAQTLTMSASAVSSQKLLYGRATSCAGLPATVGGQYRLSAWYKSDQVVRLEVFTVTSTGASAFFGGGSFGPAADWAQAVATTGPIPSGTASLLVSLAFGPTSTPSGTWTGTVTMDDFSLNLLDPVAPSVDLTAPAAGAATNGALALAATATDNAGVAKVDFLVDGATVATSTAAPYGATWDSTTVTEGSHVVAAKATDTAGNTASTATRAISVDRTPPAVTVTCNGGSCAASAPSPVTVALNAADGAGSGVASVRYTTDGSDPASGPTATTYSGPFGAPAGSTVRYLATDAAGNTAGSTTLGPAPVVLTALTVTPAYPNISKGSTRQLAATGTYSDGTTADRTASVTWGTSDPTVATVTAAGVVTAQGAGSATVSATEGSVTGSTTVTVSPATLVSIAVTPANPSVPKGATRQLAATGTYSDGTTADLTGAVTWSSANPAVLTVTSAGLVKAVAPGSATVSATQGSTSGSTTVTVAPAALSSIAVTPANLSKKNGKQQFTATGTYTDGTTADVTASVTWTSSNTTVATISSTGLATIQRSGTTTVTAQKGTVTGSTTLKVP